MNEGYVNSVTESEITTIEFFHPKSNSLPATLLQQLTVKIEEAGEDENSKVIVIKSAGERAFCAGASFNELLAIEDEGQGLQFFAGFANVINAMRKCKKLIIGRIHGDCVGGGVGIASAVDYAIATKSVRVKLSELAVGIGPFVVGPAIERKIGASGFSELAIDAANWRSAEWANSKGLFAETHETFEELDVAVQNLAASLVKSNPDAMSAMKRIFWRGTDDWDDLLRERAQTSGKLVLSEFTVQAINKFRKG